jgi:Pyruvate/2-oxoacid:ferredoxin oxidoreductase delta subunit
MAPKRIRLWRGILQGLCFVIVLYGALLWRKPAEPLPKIDPGKPQTTMYGRDRLLWVSGDDTVAELYPPTLTCRFAAEGGVFKACSVHMLSENLTWRTKLGELIPHVFLLIVLSFLFARYWCGWICPLGATTDFLNAVRKRFGVPDWHVPGWADSFLRGTRHFLLWATLGISIVIALPVLGLRGVNDSLFLPYCQICPARLVYPTLAGVQPCLYDFTDRITIFFTILGWIALAFFLAGFFVPRLWCRVCAIGALLSYFNRGGAARLVKDASKCTFCGTCRRCCPMDIEMVYRERERPEVTDTACVLCLRCVEECPEPGCLSAKLGKLTVSES